MKTGWVRYRLRDVTTKIGSGATPLGGETAYKTDGISLIRSLNVHDWGFRTKDLAFIDDKQAKQLDNVVVEKGDVLLNITGASVARCCVVPDEMIPARVNQHVSILRPKADQLLPKLLHYMLISKDYKDRLLYAGEGGGSTRQALTKSQLQEFWIEFPDALAEQQRIVGILDEAFDGIAAAKANAEKNFQNARALFESHLQAVFTQRGEGWVEKKLSEVCEITSTLVDPRKDDFLDLIHVGAGNIEQKTGVFVDLKSAREEGLISGKFFFDNSMVLYSKIRPYLMKVGRPDFSGLCSADMYPLSPLSNQADRDFLFHLLLSKPFTDYAIKGSARSGMPKVNREHLFEFRTWLPSVKKQKELAGNLDALHEESQRLESLYRRKLASLDELKKSLLHQAFSGQLGSAEPITEVLAAPFLTTIPNISSTDLHAGILARAYQLHEERGVLEVFGHVKAEKIAHMVEARLGIDLDRKPVKDAAGPNDFPRLMKVEHRARMAQMFDFKRKAGGVGYQMKPLPGFEKHIRKTFDALGERREEVDELLAWMLPMSREQAEIIATIFAAWNNLLLDGKRPSDEEIVQEAREKWHPDKLKIDREKFFKAISWLREEGVVPEGKGKRVVEKGA